MFDVVPNVYIVFRLSREEPLVASLLLVVRPGAPSSFLLLVVRMLLVAMLGAPSSFLLLVVRICS